MCRTLALSLLPRMHRLGQPASSDSTDRQQASHLEAPYGPVDDSSAALTDPLGAACCERDETTARGRHDEGRGYPRLCMQNDVGHRPEVPVTVVSWATNRRTLSVIARTYTTASFSRR